MPRAASRVIFLDPTVSASERPARMASRPATLSGKVLGCLWNNRAMGDRILEMVSAQLDAKYGLKRIVMRKKHYIGEPASPETLTELASSCDVVITALGD